MPLLTRPENSRLNMQEALLRKEGVVSTREDGTCFLLVWLRDRRNEIYQGIIAGNQLFWTLEAIPNGDLVQSENQTYIIRGSTPLGNGFIQVECQPRAV